ncbi:ATL36 [Symbiodinium sp. CCMP2592]|nr:ATL36 [Symbiodinium sp. CCMP2592]
MDDYREAQRAKWLRAQSQQSQSQSTQEDAAHVGASSQGSLAEPRPEVHSHAAGATAVAGAPGALRESSGSSLKQNARRVHILPVFPSSCDQSQRLEILSPLLRSMRNSQTPVKTGLFLRPAGYEFVVVKCEPDDAILAMNTDYFIEGSPLKRFEKVQFICLWDFERTRTDQDATALFQEYINPYFKSLNSNEVTSIVSVNEQLQINGMEFQVMAAEPVPPEIGIVDLSTVVFVDWDNTPEFSKIHFVPFQDTLPAAYEYDIFNDYLKPYLTRNKQQSFAMNDQFTFQGVQFKVVCCEPRGERGRIGKNTTIYCEGVLHPSLRNLLPPEMLEQLQSLPPGLQMMLLNTEALAGGYEERLMEVQEILSRRHGMAQEVIDRIPSFRWTEDQGRQTGQTQCMVCLCPFDDDEVRRLPCGHVFHRNCIDEWLRRCTDCPICKANVDRSVRQY